MKEAKIETALAAAGASSGSKKKAKESEKDLHKFGQIDLIDWW